MVVLGAVYFLDELMKVTRQYCAEATDAPQPPPTGHEATRRYQRYQPGLPAEESRGCKTGLEDYLMLMKQMFTA